MSVSSLERLTNVLRLNVYVWLLAAGMPDVAGLESMMNNPMMQSMMQSFMQNPQMMQMASQFAGQFMGPRGPPQ